MSVARKAFILADAMFTVTFEVTVITIADIEVDIQACAASIKRAMSVLAPVDQYVRVHMLYCDVASLRSEPFYAASWVLHSLNFYSLLKKCIVGHRPRLRSLAYCHHVLSGLQQHQAISRARITCCDCIVDQCSVRCRLG